VATFERAAFDVAAITAAAFRGYLAPATGGSGRPAAGAAANREAR
jgi:hypothetical protein